MLYLYHFIFAIIWLVASYFIIKKKCLRFYDNYIELTIRQFIVYSISILFPLLGECVALILLTIFAIAIYDGTIAFNSTGKLSKFLDKKI